MKPAYGLLLNPRIYFLTFHFWYCFCYCKYIKSTKKGTLTGKVYDAALNQPLSYVNVLLLLLNEARNP